MSISQNANASILVYLNSTPVIKRGDFISDAWEWVKSFASDPFGSYPRYKQLREGSLQKLVDMVTGGTGGAILGGLIGYLYPMWKTEETSELLSSVFVGSLLGTSLGALTWPSIKQYLVD